MEIRPYQSEDFSSGRAFHQRLQHKRPDLKFLDVVFDPDEAPRIVQRIVAVDETGIHGSYSVRSDPHWLEGQREVFHHFGYPVSEGTVDRRYASVGVLLQFDLQKRFTYPYAIGGSYLSSPVNQLRIRGGWQGVPIPFFYRIENANRFLRNLPALNKTPWRRIGSSVLAWSRLAGMTRCAVQAPSNRRMKQSLRNVSWEIVSELPAGFVDELDAQCRSQYRLVAVRNQSCLRSMLKDSLSGIALGLVKRNAEPIGWFVAVNRVENKAKHFADLRVGMIADFLASPRFSNEVLASALQYLRTQPIDLIACNASHSAWTASLKALGFRSGPSNFPFLGPPQLLKKLQPFPESLAECHLTRGDGDGLQLYANRKERLAAA